MGDAPKSSRGASSLFRPFFRFAYQLLIPYDLSTSAVSWRIVGIAGAVTLIVAPIALSSQPWALTTSLPHPHNGFYDWVYRLLDPLFLYLVTGFLSILLLGWPPGVLLSDVRRQWKRLHWLPVQALVILCVVTGLLLGVEHFLKIGLGRARPITRIEHTIIAARLEGWLPPEHLATLRPELFQCPIGRLAFAPGLSSRPEVLLKELQDRGALNDVAVRAHLSDVFRLRGIGPFPVEVNAEVAAFRQVEPWRLKRVKPFLISAVDDHLLPFVVGHLPQALVRWLSPPLRIDPETCDVDGSAPSGHVIRQSFVLLLFFAVAYYHVGLSVRRWPWRWKAFCCLQAVAFVVCIWSRIYGHQHTWSDEMLSFSLALGTLSVARLVQLIAFASERRVLRMLLAPGFADLLGPLHLLMMLVDRTGQILVWNREAERITGYSAVEVPTLQEFVKKAYPLGEAPQILERELQSLGQRREEGSTFTLIRVKNGAQKLIFWNTTFLTAEDGALFGRIAVGFEINRFDRRLADIGASMASFVHGLRRDLDAAVNKMTGNDTRGSIEILERTLKECDDFRQYARGDAEHKRTIWATDLIKQAISTLELEAASANVILRPNLPEGIAPLFGEGYLLQHALTDLARNAIRVIARTQHASGPDETEIFLRARQVQRGQVEYLEIEVADHGPGLSPELKKWIAGSRYEDVGEQDRELGLGLLLATLAAREHAGWLYCREENGLNIVGLTLPVAPAAMVEASPVRASGAAQLL
jgi:PAS domain S-box-containing protein